MKTYLQFINEDVDVLERPKVRRKPKPRVIVPKQVVPPVVLPKSISIEEFLNELTIGNPYHTYNDEQKKVISDWWNKNRSRIKIHYFSFKATEPIIGCILDGDTVAVNSKFNVPIFIKLFVSLHKSYHTDQHKENRFHDPYYMTVMNDQKEEFLKNYKELEKEANDLAVKGMKEMNIQQFNDEYFVNGLRSNEKAGEEVWQMMKDDIKKYNPVDFFDLFKKQIL